jgi:hypothetical protein
MGNRLGGKGPTRRVGGPFTEAQVVVDGESSEVEKAVTERNVRHPTARRVP